MQTLKAIVAVFLGTLIGTVVSCATMGGGGMRYLADHPAGPVQSVRAQPIGGLDEPSASESKSRGRHVA